MSMLSVALLIIVFLLYVLFISRSQRLGKFVYELSMNVERKRAGLHAEVLLIDDMPITYYRSNANKGKNNKVSMLLLHGFSSDKTIWHRFAMQAKDDYELVIPDLLGHGETPYSPSQSYSTFVQSKMLMKFIHSLGIQQYYVVGNSMGGMIAMQLLLQDSKRAKKAVLLDPAGVKSEFAIKRSEKGMNPFLLGDIKDFFRFYNSTMSRPPFVPPCVLHYIAQRNYLKKYEQFEHMFNDFFKPSELFDKAFDINPKRLHIIWGEKDQLLPVSEAEIWFALSQSPVQIYADIGHMPMVETPYRTYIDCRDFLQR